MGITEGRISSRDDASMIVITGGTRIEQAFGLNQVQIVEAVELLVEAPVQSTVESSRGNAVAQQAQKIKEGSPPCRIGRGSVGNNDIKPNLGQLEMAVSKLAVAPS